MEYYKSCENCIYSPVCKIKDTASEYANSCFYYNNTELYLRKPCLIGETVYYHNIDHFENTVDKKIKAVWSVFEGTVANLNYNSKDKAWWIIIDSSGARLFGTSVFLSKAEAVAALNNCTKDKLN